MTQQSKTLAKNPPVDEALDFYRLRRDGIGYIVQMGSDQWTDYNVHDPGITILEALCYAITDFAYRIGWPIENILTPPVPSGDPSQPYPNQAFFTARQILTVNPVTLDDLRKLLIDLVSVRNAWLLCKKCACETPYLAYCKNDALILSYLQPEDKSIPVAWKRAKGLYEVLLELEADPELGDLNDRKVEQKLVFHDANGVHTVIMELRFPDISLINRDQWELFLASAADFAAPASFDVKLTRMGATKAYDLFTQIDNDPDRDKYILTNRLNVFYASFEIDVPAGKIIIENATLRLIGDLTVMKPPIAQALRSVLISKSKAAFIPRYRDKEDLARTAVTPAKDTLLTHRNLDEDYCLIKTVEVEEVAVCADVEVAPDADIEEVQAMIWFEIEQYLNPPIPFYTLQDLRDAGMAVDDIFDGPELTAGFIRPEDLEKAGLKATLRVSDLLERLMAIPGVDAVNRLLLTKYDSEGNPVKGAADPTWNQNTGKPVFDPNKVSASWLLFISPRHQPRYYLNLSRFLFYKNGLPFLPRLDEATDVLNQLRGAAQQPKHFNAKNDLDIPKGTYSNPEDYYPVQYSLPEAYGTGPAGLPSTVPVDRRAKARQLKAYLMVYEQLLADSLSQLAHTADLFSLDLSVSSTYFAHPFDKNAIAGLDTLAKPEMTPDALRKLLETKSQFLERRNRFLNHLLARFGEDFNEYALLLTNAAGEQVAEQQLIENKIAFLKEYPAISHNRARAFDYRHAPCSPDNVAGIKKRIMLLLGYPDLSFQWVPGTPEGGITPLDYVLTDTNRLCWLVGKVNVSATGDEAIRIAYDIVIQAMVGAESNSYDIPAQANMFGLVLRDSSGNELGHSPLPFESRAEALDMQSKLMAWSANQRMIVVEHLLLRPKFPGDALYPACSDGGCNTCDADPYSFRLTLVMPGWIAEYTGNLDLRRFAERTIQQETPSHLLVKTCWVGNDGFVENPCEDVIGDLADLLVAKGHTAADVPPSSEEACACANALYHAFTAAFSKWYADKTLEFVHADALATLIAAEFNANVNPGEVGCTTQLGPIWADIVILMTSHFVDIARNGWQFERFETAWCKWLTANAAIDWTEERLLDRVQAMIAANLTSAAKISDICACANAILTTYGSAFYDWMQANLAAGNSFDHLTEFVPPKITLCGGMIDAGTADAIQQFLGERYGAYSEVSYRLWVVVNLLAQLRNTYPGATLHDCDDGSDQNPVRLDNTALGNYPLRTGLN